jgi:aryl carrier-like protein
LGRYLADGSIEYLGRLDHQVKIRGIRIELGEIESVMRQHPAVLESVVIVNERGAGDKRLAAYLVALEDQSPTASELRDFLKDKLPDYMIPASFMVMDELPLTPNGKVNRRALPVSQDTGASSQHPFLAPRTPVEVALAELWRELLGVEGVGLYDHFMELGGHSLLLTQLAARIRKGFQVDVPLRTLFEGPTLAEMSKAILAKQLTQVDKSKMEAMLKKLKNLSPEEMKAALEAESLPIESPESAQLPS